MRWRCRDKRRPNHHWHAVTVMSRASLRSTPTALSACVVVLSTRADHSKWPGASDLGLSIRFASNAEGPWHALGPRPRRENRLIGCRRSIQMTLQSLLETRRPSRCSHSLALRTIMRRRERDYASQRPSDSGTFLDISTSDESSVEGVLRNRATQEEAMLRLRLRWFAVHLHRTRPTRLRIPSTTYKPSTAYPSYKCLMPSKTNNEGLRWRTGRPGFESPGGVTEPSKAHVTSAPVGRGACGS